MKSKVVLCILAIMFLTLACDDESSSDETGTDLDTDSDTDIDTDTDTDADTDADADADADADTDSDTDSGSEECGNVIVATLRDFSKEHPDFEKKFPGNSGPEVAITGIVDLKLGSDSKPVFANSTNPEVADQIESADTFNQWYNTIDGVNYEYEHEIELIEQADGTFVYDDAAFFPLPNDFGFGSENEETNFHFTTEVHLEFTYEGGEVFSFRGDDDLWMFIGDDLVIDLGGLHLPQESSVNLDDLNLQIGAKYPMHIFHAERHTEDSNFKITTTIGCFDPIIIIK